MTGSLCCWLLHGGPGDVQSPFISTYAPYERDFVLVQWDERGTGQTFAKNGAAGVTLERLIADGIDLARQLRRRFSGEKLILFGHSWGSLIATEWRSSGQTCSTRMSARAR
jgi:pimeloyl-ACP methyl ester carboxylesterase